MNNSMAQLSERIQQQLKADQQAVSDQTTELLKKHEAALQQLSADALNTMKAAMQLQNDAMQRHNDAMTELHRTSIRNLRFMVAWPLISILVIGFLVIVGVGVLSSWKLRQADSEVEAKQEQIRQLTAEFCASPAGKKVCKQE